MITKYFAPEDVPFNFECAYRFLKIRRSSDKFATMHKLLADLYKEHRGVFEPRYRYDICKVASGQSGTFSTLLESGASFSGRGIHKLLLHARYAAVFLITVGEKIDGVVAELSQKDFTEAFFLDGIASTMTDGMQQLLESELKTAAATLNCTLGARFAPGYAHWDLQEQAKLFRLLKAEEIGMQLSETYFMLPQKSISGVYGLRPTPEMKNAK